MIKLKTDSRLYKVVMDAFVCTISDDCIWVPEDILRALMIIKGSEIPIDSAVLLGDDPHAVRFQLMYKGGDQVTFKIGLGEIFMDV